MAETFAARGDAYWSVLRSAGPEGRLASFSSLQWGSERAAPHSFRTDHSRVQWRVGGRCARSPMCLCGVYTPISAL